MHQHFYNLAEVRLNRPSVVTIGVFDGVHRGHQYLLGQLVQQAQQTGRLAVVITLFPHPDRVLRGLTGRYYLTTPEQKAERLGALGIDVVITHPFDNTVRQMRAAEFIDMLRERLNLASLWVTADFALGYKREGDFAFLSAQGREKGFEVQKIDLLASHDNEQISSSAIREALLRGDVEKAAALLGYAYRVSGLVVHGDHRGRSIGFPTANMAVWDEQIIPANGVYACWAWLDGQRFMAAANIGQRPTFGGDSLRVEAHLLDFDQDIYGKTLTLDFVARLRAEQKFENLEALIQQIGTDTQRGRAILSALT